MNVDYGAFDTALKAAAGDDALLALELRASFIESAKRQISLLSRSRCDANWLHSCWRLKGLAASFGAIRLMELAEEAALGAPGDPVIVRHLAQAFGQIEKFSKD